MECLWCDEPTEDGKKLCPECDAINSGPVFHCKVNLDHLPTLGDCCAECQRQREAEERRAAANAPIIAQLESIRAQHIEDFEKPWPGMEFAKGHFGMMLDRALAELKG